MANLSFIKKSLPWLGTIAGVLVPGAAPLINVATKIVGDKLNKNIAPDVTSLADALQTALGDPAQHAQLLEAENAYKQAMQAMGYQHCEEMEQIAEKDRESARTMQIANKSWIPGSISALVLLSTFTIEAWYSWAIFHGAHFSADGAVMIGRIQGTLDTATGLVLAYWFGSSIGSDRKTEILANGTGGK